MKKINHSKSAGKSVTANTRPVTLLLFSLGCLIFAIFFYPQMRQSNLSFLQERQNDSGKTFVTLSIIKGTIEAAKHIPVIEIVANRLEPVEEMIDLLWRFSLLSYIFNIILKQYILADSIFTIAIMVVIAFLLLKIICERQKSANIAASGGILENIISSPLGRTIYHSAIVLALILPLYVMFSSKFYQSYHAKHVQPEYEKIAEMFAEVTRMDEKIREEKAEKLLQEAERKARQQQIEKERNEIIQGKKEQLKEIEEYMSILQNKIDVLKEDGKWKILGKSEEQKSIEDQEKQLEKQHKNLEREVKSLSDDETWWWQRMVDGIANLKNVVVNFVSTTKDYTVAYSKSIMLLLSKEGRDTLQAYVFNGLALYVLYFAVFPLILLLVVRSMFKGSELAELKRTQQELQKIIQQQSSGKITAITGEAN